MSGTYRASACVHLNTTLCIVPRSVKVSDGSSPCKRYNPSTQQSQGYLMRKLTKRYVSAIVFMSPETAVGSGKKTVERETRVTVGERVETIGRRLRAAGISSRSYGSISTSDIPEAHEQSRRMLLHPYQRAHVCCHARSLVRVNAMSLSLTLDETLVHFRDEVGADAAPMCCVQHMLQQGSLKLYPRADLL